MKKPGHEPVEYNLRENDLQMLVAKRLKAAFSMDPGLLFYEVPIRGSRADILCVQPPMPYETVLRSGIHVFEVKMKADKDRWRLKAQLRNYETAVDYVWLVGVNKIVETENVRAGLLLFDTKRCGIEISREARSTNGTADVGIRQELLTMLAKDLKDKYVHVCDMARTNRKARTNRIMIQRKLPVEFYPPDEMKRINKKRKNQYLQ
jgi:hypothetical protein